MAKKKNPRAALPLDAEVGNHLRSYRNAAGMSQAELGEKLGVSFQQVQKYEKGTNHLSLAKAIAVCEILSCNIADLTGPNGLKHSTALDGIDFKMMEQFSGLDPLLKPNVLTILRQLNSSYKRHK
jgi:transcriptional regulator with XRE-family HTH domain